MLIVAGGALKSCWIQFTEILPVQNMLFIHNSSGWEYFSLCYSSTPELQEPPPKKELNLLLPGRKGKRGRKTSRATIQKGCDLAKCSSSSEDDLTQPTVKWFAGSAALGSVPGKQSILDLQKSCPNVTKWFLVPMQALIEQLGASLWVVKEETPFRGCGSLPYSPPLQHWQVHSQKVSATVWVCQEAEVWAILPWLTGLWGLSFHKWHTHVCTNKTLAISFCKSLAASRGKECKVIWCLHYLHNMNQFVSKLLCGLIPDCRENQAGREDYYLQLV